ncbi:ATP-binding cassette domain-containing protein [Bacillus thuringiensis]|uniref:ATP-binding cassette domain-containing protein n=1 Tax=Bacillus TaxID=1386 RepID=UPI0009D83459|nr:MULTISPECIES: ATP-binding cassette domain-containing protein [Bacillus]MED2749699.1 ATP-binding cassette domain-containing protein [Bacillus thuringiensis]EKS7845603.1 ATP-binding cassette domain-containing protein [Bacillus cereus]MEB2589717.1 ATP-binding cassette domain-containing protein [Bacillus cereus]MEB2641492.1 ATP-binding cassette domain-containing protein [Bacillus sp. DAG6]MED2754779.1 ATP-binding cassette domain-containing protein [Bacillus thuringiensis]
MIRKISVNNISKTLKRKRIISDFSCEMISGRTYGFQGANGSGKTVLFKMVLGFLKPDSGTIKIDDKLLYKDIEYPNDTGFIIEYPGFVKYYTGKENLRLLSSVQNLIDDKDIDLAMNRVELDPKSKMKVKNYSLGMKQRLGIAQAFMENPSLIILDEPTNALDKNGIRLLINLIREWQKDGKCVLLTSHNESFLTEVCTDLFIFEESGIRKEVILR